MKYGKYHIDSMPVGDDTGDHYNVVYIRNPNGQDFDQSRDEIDNFTVTVEQEQAYGSLKAAVIAYMRQYHPDNSPTDERTYRHLNEQHQRLQANQLKMILTLLSLHGRVSSYPEPDENGDIEYPISMAFYSKHYNPSIYITDVYIDDDGIVKVDGANVEIGTHECGFQVHPEHYAWVLDFIASALGYKISSPWKNLASRIKRCISQHTHAIRKKALEVMGVDPLSLAYRRVRSCTDYEQAVEILRKSGFILSERENFYNSKGRLPVKGYLFYTNDDNHENSRGITLIYTLRQTGNDTYVPDKIISVECNR